jgi:hypothetical protein
MYPLVFDQRILPKGLSTGIFFVPYFVIPLACPPHKYDTLSTGRILVPKLRTLEQVVGSLYGRNKGGSNGDGKRHSDPPPHGGSVDSAAAVVAERLQRGSGCSGSVAVAAVGWQCVDGSAAVAAVWRQRGGGSVAVVAVRR